MTARRLYSLTRSPFLRAIVLDLMQPQAAGRQRVGFGGKARRNEAGRKSTRTGKQQELERGELEQAAKWRTA